MERLMPLNESNVYERDERGLSSGCAQGVRSDGNESYSQQTLKVSSCDLGTKSSLGPNCYCTRVYIHTKTSTRSCSASATDAAKYPTCLYSDFEYQYTASLIVFVVLCQRINRKRVIRGFQEWQPAIQTVPYSYSSGHNHHSKQSEMYQSPCVTAPMVIRYCRRLRFPSSYIHWEGS